MSDSYVTPTVCGHTLKDIVVKARAMGANYIPMAQEFLPDALAMMAVGEIASVEANPRHADGIIIIIEEVETVTHDVLPLKDAQGGVIDLLVIERSL